MLLNPNILELEYAVRGPIPQRAAELRAAGRATLACNIGNPQALGQPPITFYRQALSLLETPALIARERRLHAGGAAARAGLGPDELIAEDVLDRCEELLARLPTGTGAYTESNGPRFVREAIARFIDARDGVAAGHGTPSDPDLIFCSNGASEAVKNIIDLCIAGPGDGLMIPIPQYPLYSAALRKAGGVQVDYHPDEASGWTLDRAALDVPLAAARARGVNVKAVVVINPGNPTGAVLPAASVRDVVAFAADNGLAVIADEVYQENTYGAPFVSFASAVGDSGVPLFSLHSTSKGFIGECGHRGGYVELRNPPPVDGSDRSFPEVLLKLASVSLCPNTVGQALTALMVTPPAPGSPSHARFQAERTAVLDALLAKATMLREAFTEMEGVECFGRTGAMYLFPRLGRLPAGTTDFDYCMALLEATGLTTVNGAGFGQRPGTAHLRIAFLPPTEQLAEVIPRWIRFHAEYLAGPK